MRALTRSAEVDQERPSKEKLNFRVNAWCIQEG